MGKTGDLWLEEYEAAIERFKSGEDLRVIFIAKMGELGCSRSEIAELICSMGLLGAP